MTILSQLEGGLVLARKDWTSWAYMEASETPFEGKPQMACTLELAMVMGNNEDNLPDYIHEYCREHSLEIKRVKIQYE